MLNLLLKLKKGFLFFLPVKFPCLMIPYCCYLLIVLHPLLLLIMICIVFLNVLMLFLYLIILVKLELVANEIVIAIQLIKIYFLFITIKSFTKFKILIVKISSTSDWFYRLNYPQQKYRQILHLRHQDKHTWMER